MPRELLRLARVRQQIGNPLVIRIVFVFQCDRFAGCIYVACRRSLDNVQLHFHELSDFALHINELRRFAPAAIKQTVGRHDARRCGRFWFNHNTHKRIKRLVRILAR
jgi:hypothetical protein